MFPPDALCTVSCEKTISVFFHSLVLSVQFLFLFLKASEVAIIFLEGVRAEVIGTRVPLVVGPSRNIFGVKREPPFLSLERATSFEIEHFSKTDLDCFQPKQLYPSKIRFRRETQTTEGQVFD